MDDMGARRTVVPPLTKHKVLVWCGSGSGVQGTGEKPGTETREAAATVGGG